MLAQIADLRFYALAPYIPAALCPADFCLRPYVVDRKPTDQTMTKTKILLKN